MSRLQTFYTALAQRDHVVMAACYHEEARFSDPVFQDLDAEGVRAMWKMLLTADSELGVSFQIMSEDDKRGKARWEAWYVLGKGRLRRRRRVHNRITSKFTFKDGLILTQRDSFSFWRWSRQAIGVGGLLLGWLPALRKRVRRTAARRLADFRLNDRTN